MALMSKAQLDVIDECFRPLFAGLIAANRIGAATRAAMELSDTVLAGDAKSARHLLWKNYFAPLYERGAVYQSQDFEIIDYDMFSIGSGTHLFRGPRPSLSDIASGNYICLIGAAQLFGRFHSRPLHWMLHQAYGIPVLNLSIGGIGIQEYLRNDYVSLAGRARLVVMQVLSGRSIGCDEYPGTWITTRKGDVAPVPREIVLRETWQQDPDEAVRLIRKWNELYIDLYRSWARRLDVPKLLLWMSDRAPDGWTLDHARTSGAFGSFPQLVSNDVIDRIVPEFQGFVACPSIPAAKLEFTSRISSLPCPYIWPDGSLRWSDDYYPSLLTHEAAMHQLRPQLDRWLR